MQDKDADRQISQMIEFIRQEAKEKADEINVKTEAEFNAKKLSQVVKARAELKDEYTTKRKEVAVKKRIARSRAIKDSRFEQMRERDQILKELKQTIFAQLSQVASHNKYADFMQALIVQGLLTILEHSVELHCRQMDLAMVKKVLPTALAQFKELVKAEVGSEPECTVTVSTNEFLPPPPSYSSTGPSCYGGITLIARNGKIICRNTLDARFEHAFAELLPVTRSAIFGQRGAAKVPRKLAHTEDEKHN